NAVCTVSADISVEFVYMPTDNADCYAISIDGTDIKLSAGSLRGYIFAYSHLLRKIECRKNTLRLVEDPSGSYRPNKPIRGHQLGYRPKNNTYDAWSPEQFSRYFRDMMFFNSNVVELMPGGTDDGNRNELMTHTENEMMYICSELADELDMDVSVWYPNCEDSTIAESAELRGRILAKMKRLNYVFPPGGDPGDFPAEEFLERAICAEREIRKTHPNVQMWPSAQKPKHIPTWGKDFIKVMETEPEEISGIITGPNRAFSLDDLRRFLPHKYPIRFYPDVTHNVRCEYPVHVLDDDWHYAFASTMGRESINPRPYEYAYMHTLAQRYIAGSVSYSEGCNDDLNKMIYGYLDFAPETPVREILEDYARVFMIGADAEKVADGLAALEKNWYGDPAENPLIDATLAIWESLAEETPELMKNWRFVGYMFRAKGDAVIRMRRIFEQKLCKQARKAMMAGEVQKAIDILNTPASETYNRLRADLYDLAAILFDTIGMQLDIANFHASAPDRGAVLETIDKPITNRTFYLARLTEIAQLPTEEQAAAAQELIAHENVREDEFIFSVTEDTLKRFGGKPLDAYLNFRGDSNGYNNGALPTSLIGLYDHFFFHCMLGGFTPGQDYVLKIAFSDRRRSPMPETDLIITANGQEIYRGAYYGGKADPEYDAKWLGGKYISQTFDLPASVFENGCLKLRLEENTYGVEFAEFRILRANN
ncbi:MAG: hypothetical protein IKU55_02245, partial [Clostridia bacterium]|nr:hypothetical protein [Clostridia bacterium]